MGFIGSFKNVFWKKEDKGITLSDVIRGLQHCVNQSKEITSLQYVSELQKYLNDKSEPIYQTVKIGDDHAVNVPILCLLGHEALELDEMEVAMDLTIKNMELKTTTKKSDDSTEERSDVPEDITRTVFTVDLNSARLEGDYTKLDLKFKFKAGAVPEAVNRIIDKLNGQVSVYKLSESDGTQRHEDKGDKA
jgi:hypothetical protein